MIFEMARFEIKSGMEANFEEGVAQATHLFKRAHGCHRLQLLRTVEQPSIYTLMVTWETVEDYMVGFRQSENFQEWRTLVGDFFAGPPQVEHSTIALAGF